MPYHKKKAPRVTKTKVTSKNGAGGKGTWGTPGMEHEYEDGMSPMDPNFDPLEKLIDEEFTKAYSSMPSKQALFSGVKDLTAFKRSIEQDVDEYSSSHDENEFLRRVKEHNSSLYHQAIPYIILKFGLDKKPSQRLKLSTLLSVLDKESIVTPSQMVAGFAKAYNNLPDLMMDTPNAKIVLAEFVAHAVDNGYLTKQKSLEMASAVDQLSNPELMVKAKKAYKSLLQEFFVSHETEEAVKQAKELKHRHLDFELIKQILSQAMDKSNVNREAASKLLVALAGDPCTEEQIAKGFTIMLQRLEDLILDVPAALRLLAFFLARAVKDEVLPPAFLARVDLAPGDLGGKSVSSAQEMLAAPGASLRLENIWEENNKIRTHSELEEAELQGADDGKWMEGFRDTTTKLVTTLRVRISALEKEVAKQTSRADEYEKRLGEMEARLQALEKAK